MGAVVKSFVCPQCGEQRHVPSAKLRSGETKKNTCPFCANTVTLEDRDGVLLVDGVAVDPEDEGAESPSQGSAAPLPPGATRSGVSSAPLPPGATRPSSSATQKATKAAKRDDKSAGNKRASEALPAESSSASQPATPAAALSGSFEGLSLPDVLMLLLESKKTGSFVAQSQGSTAKIFLNNGSITGCRHPLAGATVGSLLIERGLVAQPQIEAAFSAIAQAEAASTAQAPTEGASESPVAGTPPKVLLATLVEMGALPENAVRWALEQFVETTLAQLLTWSTGSFAFELSDGTISNADLKDPQVAFAGPAIDPPASLKNASRFAPPPPPPTPEPIAPTASASQPAAALGAAPEGATSDPAAAGKAASKSSNLAWLAAPALVVGLAIGGFAAYRIDRQRVACAGELEAALAKPPPACPATACPTCPTPTPCDATAAADKPADADTGSTDVRKAKNKGGKSKAAPAKRTKAKGKAKGTGGPGAPDINSLFAPDG